MELTGPFDLIEIPKIKRVICSGFRVFPDGVKCPGCTDCLQLVCDHKRHLVCLPYSIKNLHSIAINLGIKRHWFHKNHYDIPITRIDEIENRSKVVDTRTIVKIIKGQITHL